MITNFTNSFQNNWDLYLPVVCWAYNTTINSATGYSPFRAMFGREAKASWEAWVEDFHHKYNFQKDNSTIDDYVTNLTLALRYIWKDITNRTLQHQERFDMREPDARAQAFTPYRPGEQFFFKTIPIRNFKSLEDQQEHKISTKFQYRYSGPHTVTRVINPVTYEARIDGILCYVHANRMKRDPRPKPPQHTPPHQQVGTQTDQTTTTEENIANQVIIESTTRTTTIEDYDPLLRDFTWNQEDKENLQVRLQHPAYTVKSFPKHLYTHLKPRSLKGHKCTRCNHTSPSRNKLHEHIRQQHIHEQYHVYNENTHNWTQHKTLTEVASHGERDRTRKGEDTR